ncbi:hypothetical protein B5P44_00935 [Mycobacterium sp. CBMA 213]|nr:hypothetical protein [Mycolicibacterium sp. CBMA 335]MUM03385.1 hypothetical protein [Mycolicibacterium sp. CBMA 213]
MAPHCAHAQALISGIVVDGLEGDPPGAIAEGGLFVLVLVEDQESTAPLVVEHDRRRIEVAV